MTPIDRFERELPAALRDVAGTGAPDYLTDILGRTARTRQRPAWASLERWLPMELASPRAATARIPWRTVGVLSLVALLLAALLVAVVGSQRRAAPPFGPAANGVIPFDRSGDIFVADPITGESRLVIGGSENDYGPTFSPDGTKIGFVREAEGGEQVMVADADGRNVRPVSPPLTTLISATWTPTSDALVLGHDVDLRQRLERFPIDGGAPVLLLEDASVDIFEYRPPDGDLVVFRGKVEGTWGLYTMRPDGSDIKLLTASTADGLPDQDLNFVSWSPDGRRIHFNRHVPDVGTIQAYVMNADGTGQRRFNATGPACCWWEGEQALSLDGRWVVMWRVPLATERGEITLYPSDGSGDGVVIGPDVVGTATWKWSPDSTRILLNYNDDAEGDQTLIDPVTGEWTVAPWADDATPEWQRKAP